LLSSDKIDQAFSLLDMSQLKPERKEYLFRRIHRKAVFLRMAELDLASCKQSILFSNIDIREVRSHLPNQMLNGFMKDTFIEVIFKTLAY
jgi:hypothetical protein